MGGAGRMIKNGRCRVPYQGYVGICHFVFTIFLQLL